MYINEIKTILTDKRLFKYVYYFEYNLERYISMCRRQTAVSTWVMHEPIVKKSTVIRQSLGVAQLKIAVVKNYKLWNTKMTGYQPAPCTMCLHDIV